MAYIGRDSQLLGLPIEIWLMSFERLQLQDLKQVRLVNRECMKITTPLCFATIAFDLSEASVRNVAHITTKEDLASHVRTAVLQRRRRRMRKFSSGDQWEASISLPDDPTYAFPPLNNSDSEGDTYNDIMSYREWSDISKAERRILYQRYENDRVAHNDNIQASSRHLCFRRVGCTFSEQVDGSALTGENHVISRLDEVLAKFTRLAAFIHRPTGLLHDRWVTRWARLRVDPYSFDNDYDEDCQEDNDIEALHLSCALRAVGWARLYLINLSSITLHVEGPAFWGPRRLRRLWQGQGHNRVRRLRELYGDAVQADVEAEPIPADFTRDDEYVRQLTIMESALEGLTHLDCSVSEDEDYGGLFMAARFLFEFLCRGQDLKRVRLAFGWLVDGFITSDYWTREKGDGPKELLTLLTMYTPWSKIKELELAIATDETTLLRFLTSLNLTLRRLTLSTVTLAPSQGSWNSALPAIAKGLTNLITLELASLCDFPQHGQQRLLFDAQAPLWASKNACYVEYKGRMVDHLLNTKELHQLEPEFFMEEHRQSCKHT